MSHVRECGEATASPEEMGGGEGVGTGLLPGGTRWLACDLGQMTSTLYLGQFPVLDRPL